VPCLPARLHVCLLLAAHLFDQWSEFIDETIENESTEAK